MHSDVASVRQIAQVGFRDDGAYCAKPGSFGRGAGKTSRSKCEKSYGVSCDKKGLLYYPKCSEYGEKTGRGSSFHAVGCCVCSPNCPSGFKDIGVSCQKPASYGRGAGKTCPQIHDGSSLEKAEANFDFFSWIMYMLFVKLHQKYGGHEEEMAYFREKASNGFSIFQDTVSARVDAY